jgi:hypothetical protein
MDDRGVAGSARHGRERTNMLMRQDTHYGVRFLEDHELPEGVDWALVHTDNELIYVVKASKVSPQALLEGWVAYMKMAAAELGRERAGPPSLRAPL